MSITTTDGSGITGNGQHSNGHASVKGDPSIPPSEGRCLLLDMPGEILSQISSYLPLPTLIQFLSLHPLLLSLTQSHLSPIPSSTRSLLSTPPYPNALSVIPHLTHFLPPDPDDAKRLFLQILVRARPKWILERFEVLRWEDEFWKEAFERRFLPSWKRYKEDEDNWRSVFYRMLGRIEHRQSGCTHEEAWTRFVTLHRNGSASLNRMYSRTFDPYEIYDELKNQNNFSSHPTTVRVLLHLQDVRIIALGVLIDQPSLFVNPNAHLTLHPPLLRHLSSPPDDNAVHQSRWFRSSDESNNSKLKSGGARAQVSSITNTTTVTNEAYFPLVRSLSPSSPQNTSYGLSSPSDIAPTTGPIPIPLIINSTSVPPISPSGSASFGRILGNYIPGRRRTQSNSAGGTNHNEQASIGGGTMSNSLGNLGGVLTLVRSRDSDDGSNTRRRTFSFGRNRSGSLSTNTTNVNNGNHGEPSLSNLAGPSTLPALSELSPSKEDDHISVYQSRQMNDRPYDMIQKPQPALSHNRYPNYTSPIEGGYSTTTNDLRNNHPEVEDEYEGNLWAGDVTWSGDGKRMAEWDEELGKRRRWVGPMIILAQIHPSHRAQPHPPGVNPNLPLEGSNPALGQNGMFASLGFEDVEALFPWIEFKGSGGNSGEAKRSGLGF
ncbi:uncharacterized protein IL334_006729 [Kwoniella shivajii]|uniref:F-box domain-containing protein n=1 Tax=Kwoniella shivajii TaxID=564305 RepID=A0ABZ1D740_9TREE|nr:hypothetical protein IL334_006729 [Kwoniella shivajii]